MDHEYVSHIKVSVTSTLPLKLFHPVDNRFKEKLSPDHTANPPVLAVNIVFVITTSPFFTPEKFHVAVADCPPFL